MFEEEREEYAKFFDFFKTMFKEDVGFIPSIYEDDDFEIDLIIGEDSGEIRGIRVLQMMSADEEEDLEWEGSAKEVLESPEEEADEDEIEEEDDKEEDDETEEDDEEDDIFEMYQYDFVATDYEPGKIVGNLCLETTFDMPNHEDEEEEEETEEEDQSIESKESESQVEKHNGEWYHLRLYGVKSETEEAEIDIRCALLENGDHPEKKHLFLPHPQLD